MHWSQPEWEPPSLLSDEQPQSTAASQPAKTPLEEFRQGITIIIIITSTLLHAPSWFHCACRSILLFNWLKWNSEDKNYIPYSRKIWWGIKFGGVVVYHCNCQIEIRQCFMLTYIHMAIPYRTAKFKSTDSFIVAIWGPTAKFNSRLYFWLCDNYTIGIVVAEPI